MNRDLPGDCPPLETLTAFALSALHEHEGSACAIHIAECAECLRKFDSLTLVAAALPQWPYDILRPGPGLWRRLTQRLSLESGLAALPALPDEPEPPWEEVAPGTFCKVLAEDEPSDRVSMLVRLLPATDYPPHEHADVEELHLLEGELWIDGRKLTQGDYNRADAGSADRRVWSDTGCTCLLITSLRDRLISRPEP